MKCSHQFLDLDIVLATRCPTCRHVAYDFCCGVGRDFKMVGSMLVGKGYAALPLYNLLAYKLTWRLWLSTMRLLWTMRIGLPFPKQLVEFLGTWPACPIKALRDWNTWHDIVSRFYMAISGRKTPYNDWVDIIECPHGHISYLDDPRDLIASYELDEEIPRCSVCDELLVEAK